jgi:hypothetical protein
LKHRWLRKATTRQSHSWRGWPNELGSLFFVCSLCTIIMLPRCSSRLLSIMYELVESQSPTSPPKLHATIQSMVVLWSRSFPKVSSSNSTSTACKITIRYSSEHHISQ